MRASRYGFAAALLAGVMFGTPAAAQSALSGEITVWSWNVTATALRAMVPAFNKAHPKVKVTIQDLGNSPVYDRGLAGCAAGGVGMPDVYLVENHESEVFWARFPDCFHDLKSLAEGEAELLAKFPAFKLAELTVGDKIYAMPWDSGPVVVFYRRDMYAKAGVDPEKIETWDQFIEAGKKVVKANGENVKFVSTNGDTSWFRMLSNQAGCGYFDQAGENVTVNQPGCVKTLETVKKIHDAGLFANANWDETLKAIKGDVLAGALYGAWFEGSIRANAAEQEGKWGLYRMPAFEPGGDRTANIGGSALAVPTASKNPQAALAFINFVLGTPEGQVEQLKISGLVPTLPEAINHPFVKEPQPYWGGQKVWELALSTLPKIKPSRGTQFYAEADNLMRQVLSDFLNAEDGSAQEALDDAAEQISSATGLPVAE